MRAIIFFILICFVSEGKSQSVSDYIRIALENNPGLKAKQTEIDIVKKRLPQVEALPDPQVNVSFFVSPMMLPMGNQVGSVSAMQMFPWPGTIPAMEEEVSRTWEVKEQALKAAENDLVFQIRSAWYPLLELERRILIQRDQLSILETAKELATFRFEQGQGPMVDVIRADIMIDNLTTEMQLLDDKREPLVAGFNRLLNRPDATPVIVTGDLPEPDPVVRMNYDTMISRNPALAIYDQQIRMTDAEEKVVDYQRKPMLGAGLQYMLQVERGRNAIEIPPNTGRDMIMPMFSVSVPIWRKKYDAAVQERRLMKTMYQEMKNAMHNDLAAMYTMSRYEMEKAVRMIELLDSQMEKTQQAIDLLIAAYQNAGTDFEEILRLQDELFRYQLERVSAQTEYQLGQVKLDYLTGNHF